MTNTPELADQIEQMRKELNELRERIAILESRTVPLLTIGVPKISPPYVVTCLSKNAS